jgi:tetratricopeptide (TPR) repeat protein
MNRIRLAAVLTAVSRTLIAAAAVTTAVACTDPGAVSAPGPAGTVASASVAPCTAERGQQLIDAGQFRQAIREFTCLIDRDPTAVEGYRGRIEAQLLLGRFSDAVRDYTRVTAFVLPAHPDADGAIIAGYLARLDGAPDAIPALTGLSFAHWYFFDYPAAIEVTEHLLEVLPGDVYGNLFLGSSRLLRGTPQSGGAADLEQAIALAPTSPDVRFIVADAYTYGGEPDAQRAFDEAMRALEGGLDTPRIRAILASAYGSFGDAGAAAAQIALHLDLVTTELVTTPPLPAGSSASLGLVPGRTYDIPIPASAGTTVSISTGSKDFTDTILVLLAPDGTPLVGSDDEKAYFAGISWVAPADGTYRLRVTSFEAVSTGTLLVARK